MLLVMEVKPIFMVGYPTDRPKELRERMEPNFPGYHVFVYPSKQKIFEVLSVEDATKINFKDLINRIDKLLDERM